MEVWKENWDSLPEAVQNELRRQGVDPHAQKKEEEEPLLKLLQEHKHSLPVRVQLELEKREPPAPTASQATGRLKGLVKKQLGLQESINETKEALRLLLGDMQSTMAAIAESQREVEEAKKELSAVVVEPGPPAPGPADMEIDELLGHIGVELTEIAESKKRKLGPPPSLPASQGDLEAVGNPPGLVATGGLGAQGVPTQDAEKEAETIQPVIEVGILAALTRSLVPGIAERAELRLVSANVTAWNKEALEWYRQDPRPFGSRSTRQV
eukprot:s13934_g1.t1